MKDKADPISSAFAHDSTFSLIKKFFIYKMMGSELFINHSLWGLKLSYKVLGMRITNTLIESTAASIFTGGVTDESLNKDINGLEERNIKGIGGFIVEGLDGVSEEKLDAFMESTLDSIKFISKDRKESHLAVKLTAYTTMSLMRKLSAAQEKFLHDVLEVTWLQEDLDKKLSEPQLRANL